MHSRLALRWHPITASAQTGHQACGAFAAGLPVGGGLERFGLPLTGAFTASLEDRPYTVQYVERRRFELHPEVGPNAVLLGLLGREVLAARQAPAPPPPPAATPKPMPLPPIYNGCAEDPSATQSPNYPGPPGNSWNNSSTDPGARYDDQGRLGSYWSD